jgi:hypothetical protein
MQSFSDPDPKPSPEEKRLSTSPLTNELTCLAARNLRPKAEVIASRLAESAGDPMLKCVAIGLRIGVDDPAEMLPEVACRAKPAPLSH